MRKRKPKQPQSAIRRMIQRMKLFPNDVVLIKRGTKLSEQDMVDKLGELFEEYYDFRIVFVVVDDFSDVKVADPATMEKFGWVNLENVSEETMLKNGWVKWPRGVNANVEGTSSPATAE